MLRITELRVAKGINMREAARLLKMPYTTYVNYEKGLREPTSEVLIQIADFYGASIDYMVGRVSVNSMENSQQCISTPHVALSELSTTEQYLIHKFRKLDDRGRAAVLNTLDHEYSALTGEEASTLPRQA